MTKDKYQLQLRNYISDMEKRGYAIEAIRQQLHNHGHAKEIVEETITELKHPKQSKASGKEEKKGEKKEHSPHQEMFVKKKLLRAKERFFILLYFVGMLAFVAWVSNATDASFGKVFACFIPTFLTILTVIIILETNLQAMRVINWVIPILYAVGFYVVAAPNNQEIFRNVDATNLTVANFVLSIIFVLFIEMLISTYSQERKPIKEKKNKPETVTTKKTTTRTLDMDQKAITQVDMSRKQQLEEYIQSIEDKCKALNFVIGRVYSNKKGGSPELRDLIKIPAEWYNEFSKVTDENFDENIVVVKKMLWSIYDRLLQMKKQENEVFTAAQIENLDNLERDATGQSPIIDVLTTNDKDPVETYYKSALDFCEKATAELDAKQ
jgi:Ca2+/Na+ antiporter